MNTRLSEPGPSESICAPGSSGSAARRGYPGHRRLVLIVVALVGGAVLAGGLLELALSPQDVGTGTLGALVRTLALALAAMTLAAGTGLWLARDIEAQGQALNEALEREAATGGILRVISRSTTDVQPVFDTIAERAARLCNAHYCFVFRFDGELLHAMAYQGVRRDGIDAVRRIFPAAPDRGTTVGRAVLSNAVVQIPDVLADPEYQLGGIARLVAYRSSAAVPLINEQQTIGAIVVTRSIPGLLPDRHIDLLQTFADQAVIAIENVRLFTALQARNRELYDALQRQTATAEVLKVISRSTFDLQAVLDTLVESSIRLCEAHDAAIVLREGEWLRFAAHHGPIPIDFARWPATRTWTAGRAVVDCQPVHVHDLQAEADEFPDGQAMALRMGHRTILSVPLMRSEEAVGALVIRRIEVRPFTDRQIELVSTFADQAVIAIENVRLFEEVQARTRELAASVAELNALGEVSQAVNSSLDIETVLDTIVTKAVQLSGTGAGSIYVLNRAGTKFRLRATYGMDEAMVTAMRDRRIRPGEGVIGLAATQRRPVQIPDVQSASPVPVFERMVQAGFRAFLVVPLLGSGHAIGALVVRRRAPGEFPQGTIELLQTFAGQSVLAIQNARLFHEIAEKSQQLEVASRHKSQFLANMSHELRTPLNAVLGYSELILDGIYGEVPERVHGALERIQTNGKHLLGLINDVLDLSKIEAGRLTLSLADYSLSEVVASVVSAVEAMAVDKGLKLEVQVQPGLPVGRGDEQRIRQVLLNLVGNAIKFTDAGSVTVTAGSADGMFRVSVIDTGPGISAADQARLFQDFQQADSSSTRSKGGTGLGLAISRRFVAMHGGRIRVASVPGAGSTFSFELPVTVAHQEGSP